MNYVPVSAIKNAEEIANLRVKLDRFYASTNSYGAFLHESNQVGYWMLMLRDIRRIIKSNDSIKILEVGAGRTGFPKFLRRELGDDFTKVSLYAQDVTNQNSDHLKTSVKEVFFGDVYKIKSKHKFDLIFSTHVFEHVTNPHQHLDHLLELLVQPSGCLFIFCPVYDFPFYVNPSARHLSSMGKILVCLHVLIKRFGTIISGEPSFLIQRNPAVLERTFFRDADAIHWVSYFDIYAWAKQKRLKLKCYRRKSDAGLLSKDGFIKRFGTLKVRVAFPFKSEK